MGINILISQWIPPLTTTALFGATLWFMRNMIANRLKQSVKHEYDQKIESIKSDLRSNEEELKAELQVNKTELEALRNGAMANVIHRQSVLYERQLIAVEKLWEAVLLRSNLKFRAEMIRTIDFDKALKQSKRDQRFEEIFTEIEKCAPLPDTNPVKESEIRPFVSDIAWAYFDAYTSILAHSSIMIQTLKSGIGKDMSKKDRIFEVVKVALPHQEQFLNEHGVKGSYYLLDELEDLIISEIKRSLKGDEVDKENVERASKIIKATRAVQEDQQQSVKLMK